MGAISEDYGFFASFCIPAVAMIIAVVVFVAGSPNYKTEEVGDSCALEQFLAAVVNAGSSCTPGKLFLLGSFLQLPGMALVIASFFTTSASSSVLSITGTGCIVFGLMLMMYHGQDPSWVNTARISNGGRFEDRHVEAALDVLSLTPYFGFMVVFNCVYAQMGASFVMQGCQMDLRVGGSEISSAQLNLFDCIVIMAFIPVFDKLVFPGIESLGYKMTLLRKVGWGMVFACLAMVQAAALEIYRKNAPLLDVHSNCSDDIFMSDVSVWWQIPQYMLVGIAEILIMVGGLDLFYSQAPETMRSVCQALNLITMTLGSMVSAGIQSIFHKWFTDDLNKGYLERLYFIFALLVLMSLGWFVHVSSGYVYREDRVHHTHAVDIVPEMNEDEETTGLLSQSKQDSDDPQHEPIHDHSM